MKDRLEVLNEAQEAVKEACAPRFAPYVVGLYRVITRHETGEVCGTVMPGKLMEAPIEARVFTQTTRYDWGLDATAHFLFVEDAVKWCIEELSQHDDMIAMRKLQREGGLSSKEVE